MVLNFCVENVNMWKWKHVLSLHFTAVCSQLVLPPKGTTVSGSQGLGSMGYKVTTFFHKQGQTSVGIGHSQNI